VKYYIYYNLVMMGILGLHSFYVIMNSESFLSKLPENADITIVWVTALFLYALVLFLFWCFYRLIYGFFLRKLKRNYAELKKRD
jgi:dolichyl-phosphate-mannose--protein O-mannosyl transferase